MLSLNIRRSFIVTLLVLTIIIFHSVNKTAEAGNTSSGSGWNSWNHDDHSSGGRRHGRSDDDSSSGHKPKEMKPAKNWLTKGNKNIDDDIHFLGTTDEADLIIKANNEEKMRVNTEGVIAGTDPSILSLDVNGLIRIRGGAPWAGFVLTAIDSDGNAVWQSISVNDADSNPFNEIQTLSQSGNSVTLSNGGGSITVADNDNDSSNEYNTGISFDGTNLAVTDAGGSQLIDISSLQGTDDQTLTFAGTGLSIEDGNTVDLAALQDGIGTDDQNLTGASLTGTTLQVDIEGGTSASVDLAGLQDGAGTDDQTLTFAGTGLSIEDGNTVDLAALQDGTGTDDQNLTGASLTGTTLQVDIEGGASASVDLAGLQDGTGTDDQTLTFAGTGLSIEDGNTVDLAGLQDGTGTDDQNLTGASLTGTTLQVDIEGGASASVDLAGLQDGTGTDDQTLTFAGTGLSIEDGNTVDLTALQDGTGTDDQNLSLTGVNLSIEDGNSVDLSGIVGGSDNLGNHIANTTLNMNSNAISNSGKISINGTNSLFVSGSVVQDGNYGVNWNTDNDYNYSIYREAGAWTSPYPDLRISFHTGIKLGAYFGYGGTRFYNNSDMATKIFSVGEGDNHTRVFHELQAPILRDLNDGNYYMDPNYISRLNDIRPTIIRDPDNVAFQVDPSGTTKLFSLDSQYINTQSLSVDFGQWGDLVTGVVNIPNFGFTYSIHPHGDNLGALGDPTRAWGYAYIGQFYRDAEFATSDKRLKENLREIESPLSNLLKLQGYLYDFKKDALGKANSTKDNLGFMAQDVREIYPQLVSYNEGNDRYYLNYEGIIPVLVEGVKELKAKQDVRVVALETEVESLKAENEQLRNVLTAMADRQVAIEEMLLALSIDLPKEKVVILSDVQ